MGVLLEGVSRSGKRTLSAAKGELTFTKLEISIRYTSKPAYNRLCKSCGTIDYECDL